MFIIYINFIVNCDLRYINIKCVFTFMSNATSFFPVDTGNAVYINCVLWRVALSTQQLALLLNS
jgi:hypothetical protein